MSSPRGPLDFHRASQAAWVSIGSTSADPRSWSPNPNRDTAIQLVATGPDRHTRKPNIPACREFRALPSYFPGRNQYRGREMGSQPAGNFELCPLIFLAEINIGGERWVNEEARGDEGKRGHPPADNTRARGRRLWSWGILRRPWWMPFSHLEPPRGEMARSRAWGEVSEPTVILNNFGYHLASIFGIFRG